jgi:hypothetical protein
MVGRMGRRVGGGVVVVVVVVVDMDWDDESWERHCEHAAPRTKQEGAQTLGRV